MTKEFEEHYKRFCKAVDDALTLWPGIEIEAVIGEEAYDPDILHIPEHLDNKGCEVIDIGIEVYTDENGYMVFRPHGKEM